MKITTTLPGGIALCNISPGTVFTGRISRENNSTLWLKTEEGVVVLTLYKFFNESHFSEAVVYEYKDHGVLKVEMEKGD